MRTTIATGVIAAAAVLVGCSGSGGPAASRTTGSTMAGSLSASSTTTSTVFVARTQVAAVSSPAAGSLQLVPNPAVQGRPATLKVAPRPPFASGMGAVDFGDGGGFESEMPIGYTAKCTSTAWQPQHVWKRPGVYHVVVELHGCLSYGYVDNDSVARLTMDVRVIPGLTSSNGPATPYGAMPVAATADAMTIHADVDAGDGDGWVTTISLDWGDGTPPAVAHESVTPCDDHGGTRYPSSTVDEDMGDHRYASPGRYTLRTTVTSTGCDGQSAQHGGNYLPIEVPCAGDYENGVYTPYSCGLHPS